MGKGKPSRSSFLLWFILSEARWFGAYVLPMVILGFGVISLVFEWLFSLAFA